MARAATLLLALLALAVAGCGGGSNSSSSGSSAPAASSSSAGTSKTSGGGITIKMQNIQFAPKQQTVKVGQKVTWENADTVAHNVTAQSGATFKSQNFGQGGTYSFTPKKAGTINYVCTVHPGMDGTLKVTG